VPTKLVKPLRREVEIDGELYTVTLTPSGLRLVRKRFRSGVALSWRTLLRQANGGLADDDSDLGSRPG
jgi:hypothetical protein